MVTAEIVTEARNTYFAAKAMADAIGEEVDATHPTPAADCDDATFEEWNERYETALMEAGYYTATDAAHEAARSLILATSEYALAVAASPITREEVAPAIKAATSKGRDFRISAHRKMLDLALRLAV